MIAHPRVSAPGKIMLAGEYAIIDGGEAVMLAVDRRAVATVTERAQELSPFLEEAAKAIAREYGGASNAARAAQRITVDTAALRAADIKLGLGSSAACTVSAVACALASASDVLDQRTVHRLAHRAHRAAQGRAGAPGSGADVAASVWGGVLVVRKTSDDDAPLEVSAIQTPANLELVCVWTGAPADTASLVSDVRALRHAAPKSYDRATARIVDAAVELISAFDRGSACSAVGALAAGGEAVARLGEAAGMPLETATHRKLRRLAERRGGALKPTGAGAGDLALAAFDTIAAARQFRADAESAGLQCPELQIDRHGVSIVSSQ